MAKTRKKVKGTSRILKPIHIDDSPSSSSNSEEEEEDDDAPEIYDVECIRSWRYNRRTKSREYFIKWRGWPEDTNTWEPEAHLSCPGPMGEFISKMTKRERKLYNTDNLDHLSGLQRNAGIECMFARANQNSSPDSPAESTSSSDYAAPSVNSTARIIFMIVFEDANTIAEEVTMEALMQYRPETAFEWIEQRLTYQSSLEGRTDLVAPSDGIQMVS